MQWYKNVLNKIKKSRIIDINNVTISSNSYKYPSLKQGEKAIKLDYHFPKIHYIEDANNHTSEVPQNNSSSDQELIK